MPRILAALVGVGLAMAFIVGLATGATIWLTWLAGMAALLTFATIGLIASPRSPLAAGLSLGLVAAGLVALWVVALGTRATAWLAWYMFAAAIGAALLALGDVFAALMYRGPIQRLRRRQAG